MWRRGALGAVTAAALAAGTLGLAPVATAAATTTNVHGGDIAGWNKAVTPLPAMPTGWFQQSDNQSNTTEVGEVVPDDSQTAPTDGFLHLATPALADKVVVQHGAGSALLSSFVTGSYDAQVIGGKVASPATYQLVIDCNGSTAGGLSTLNFVDGGQTAAQGWKTLDVVNGGNAMWWSTKTLNADGTTAASSTAPTAGGLQGGPTAPHSLNDIKSTCASGTVDTYGVGMGSGSAGQDGNVDMITFNDEVTNFQYVWVDRISGLNRVATAVQASQALFDVAGASADASADDASVVVLANSMGFADGVSGVPLAAALNGPLLLTAQSSLDPATATEVTRILPAGGTVYVLGGVGAISANVATSLTSRGFKVTRLWGATRFETAVAVADSIPGATKVLLTSGLNFPDALSAGPAAAHTGGVVLLTAGPTMSDATKTYLAKNPGVEVFAVGGDAAKAAPTTDSAHQLVGIDRYETGTKVASKFFTNPAAITFASGQNFPDALSGGAFSALIDSPILLVRSSSVPTAVTSYLRKIEMSVSNSALVGGTGVVIDTVLFSVEDSLNGF